MSIIFHVFSAIISIIITGLTAVAPTQFRLMATYVTIAATVFSGILLGILHHSMIIHVCVSGLTYLAIEVCGVVFSIAKFKRVAETVRARV